MSNIIQYFEPSYKWRKNIKQQFFGLGALGDGLIGLGLGPA